ncbi:hypothetical protein CGQ36_27735 [Nocardiopsis dassonvillei]|nr:hypothetical protein CGQ36_27735 [Nocardiopsis dassonvillei]
MAGEEACPSLTARTHRTGGAEGRAVPAPDRRGRAAGAARGAWERRRGSGDPVLMRAWSGMTRTEGDGGTGVIVTMSLARAIRDSFVRTDTPAGLG